MTDKKIPESVIDKVKKKNPADKSASAREEKADLLIVEDKYFWKNENIN